MRANAIWTQIAEQNTNFEYAFQGLGNAQLSDMRYEEAMDSFKYANDPEGYSEAFVLYRKQAIDRVVFGDIRRHLGADRRVSPVSDRPEILPVLQRALTLRTAPRQGAAQDGCFSFTTT